MKDQMTAEDKELARRLAKLSNVFDESAAEDLVLSNPEEARALLAQHERTQALKNEIAQSRQRLQAAVLR
ncbi:MAG TPA: hypothetical protein VLL27_03520 [Solirubrobacterales bacterium]|nr:hypothetical protein [Solirubrobacterales bacterium]